MHSDAPLANKEQPNQSDSFSADSSPRIGKPNSSIKTAPKKNTIFLATLKIVPRITSANVMRVKPKAAFALVCV